MASYRLEVWFNYATGVTGWGMAQANPGGDPPFSNGGSALAKVDDKVSIRGAGNSSSFDIYVFDVTNDGVARDLQYIRIDYERAQGNSSNRDPISWAPALRDGMTGEQFCSRAGGYTSGVGEEEIVFSAPGTPTAQRRWSLASGYQGITPGHYTFTVQLVVTPTGSGKALFIDPEMDIDI